MGIFREVHRHLSWKLGFGHALSERPHKCLWWADRMAYGVGYSQGKDVKPPEWQRSEANTSGDAPSKRQ
jgi:hypothetical protein